MNQRALWLSSLIAGVVMGLLGGLPLISVANCLLCMWVWGSAIFAVFLYYKFEPTSPKLSAGQGAVIGVISGVIGAVIVWLLSLLTKGMATQAIADVFATAGVDLPAGLFSTGFSIVSLLIDVVLYAIFGVIGGLIGASVIKVKQQA